MNQSWWHPPLEGCEIYPPPLARSTSGCHTSPVLAQCGNSRRSGTPGGQFFWSRAELLTTDRGRNYKIISKFCPGVNLSVICHITVWGLSRRKYNNLSEWCLCLVHDTSPPNGFLLSFFLFFKSNQIHEQFLSKLKLTFCCYQDFLQLLFLTLVRLLPPSLSGVLRETHTHTHIVIIITIRNSSTHFGWKALTSITWHLVWGQSRFFLCSSSLCQTIITQPLTLSWHFISVYSFFLPVLESLTLTIRIRSKQTVVKVKFVLMVKLT